MHRRHTHGCISIETGLINALSMPIVRHGDYSLKIALASLQDDFRQPAIEAKMYGRRYINVKKEPHLTTHQLPIRSSFQICIFHVLITLPSAQKIYTMRFSILAASIIAGYVSSTPHDDWRYQQVAKRSTSASSVSGQIELSGEQRICECRITASGSSPSVIFSGIPCAAVGGRECFNEIGNSISVRFSILLTLVIHPGLSFMPPTSPMKEKSEY